jgi:methionine synthase I (cobalamin-dependent)
MAHRLLEALRSDRVLLMDGAMGTELRRLGLKPPGRPEDWNVEQPDAVRTVHRGYTQAGAEVLLTNTFQANPIALADRPASLADTLHSGLGLAAEFAGPVRFILLDVGPMMSRDGREFPEPQLLRRVVGPASKSNSIDGILLETCSTGRVRFAVNRCRDAGLPLLLSLTFANDGSKIISHDGHAPEWFAERAADWGADALGVNCGREISMGDCAQIVRQYRTATDLPLFARPNAGTPLREGDAWIYPRSPMAMAAELPQLLEAGASMVGGCCGTTPAHILAFRAVVDAWNGHRAS